MEREFSVVSVRSGFPTIFRLIKLKKICLKIEQIYYVVHEDNSMKPSLRKQYFC